jgi:steroid delta-isomerase-like uncharacterized protein
MNENLMTDLVRQHIDAFNARNWDLYKNMMLPEAVYEEPATACRAVGPDAIVKGLETWTVAFPDLRGTIKNLIVQNDLAVAEIRWEGTHKGLLELPFGEIPPTLKTGLLDAVEVFRMKGDKLYEVRHYFDVMTILDQVGMPLPHLVATPV